jgi:hypothetical protein
MTQQKKPVLEPTTQAFVDALNAQGGKPLYELSYADARKLLEDAQTIDVKKLPADVEEKVLPVGPGGEISVRICTGQYSCHQSHGSPGFSEAFRGSEFVDAKRGSGVA